MSSTRLLTTLLIAGFTAVLALPARAQFIGDYLFSGPTTYLYSGDGYEYAAWTIEANMDGDGVTEGAIWTAGLPDSVIIEANAVSTAATSGSVRLTTSASVVASASGTIHFTFTSAAEGNATGGFFYTVWDAEGNRQDSAVYGGSGSFSISVQPNYGFAFNVFAEDLTAAVDDHDFFSATVTDFSFAPVPEPASAAALLGVGALALAASRRRRA